MRFLFRRHLSYGLAPALLLLALAAAPALAQGERTAAGRVLSREGTPVPFASVRVTPLPDGAARATQADSAGRWSLAVPAAERYEIRAERVGFYGLAVEVAAAPGQARIERDIRLTSRALELAPLEASAPPPPNRPPAGRSPGGQDEAGLSSFGVARPGEPGDRAGRGARRRGVLALGGEGGLSIGGQPPSQNGVTLDGASFGATSLPAEALRSTAVATSTFDPSRGQFSGGQIASTTLSGTNLFGGVARVRAGHPALQAGGGAGQEYRMVQMGGGAGGPLARDRFFWYGAVQATHRADPLVTLQSADGELLRSLGVSPDSARRLREIAGRLGHAGGRVPSSAGVDAGSALLRLDLALGQDHVAMARLDGRGSRLRGLAESPAALAGSGGEVRDHALGTMLQLTSYLGESRNELRAYRSGGERRASPYLAGPSASVWVASELGGGDVGSAELRFGGSSLALSEIRTSLWELSDELMLSLGRRSRAKVGFVLNREETRRSGSANPYGTFTFASLAELDANRPAAFTRTLGERRSRATTDYLAAFAGHLWRPRPTLSLVYGLRLEGRRYPGGMEAAPVLDSLFGARAGRVPGEWGVSPRLGFTYEDEGGGWALRGGVGEFRGKVPVAPLAAALGETGEPGAAQLVCLGPAAPAPEWGVYAGDPAAVPATCAGGTPVFAAQVPRATLFARDFGAPRTWHGTLGWDWSRSFPGLGLLVLTGEATWLRGLSQTVAGDLNLAAAPAFALAEEGNRPVYASPAQVDPGTGGVAPAASRLFPGLGAVREVRSDGRSQVAQLSVGATMMTRSRDLVALYYTLTRARDEVGSLAAPGAYSQPLAGAAPGSLVEATSDVERRHLFQLRWTHPVRRWPLELGVVGRLVSGAPFTPRVSGDVNGDGAANDAAFVFDPAGTADTAVAAGMRRLLEEAPPSTRACLRAQLGRVAGRNACRAPWSAELDLQANVWLSRERRSGRFTATIIAGNVLAGLDRALHGADGIRGWGQPLAADPTLLRVRGFDAAAGAFRYEVNPGFGAPRAGRIPFHQPFTLTIQGRWTLGSDPIRQPLLAVFSSIRSQGRTPAQVREALSATIPNVPAQVLALNDTLRLALSAAQQGRLSAAADSLGRRLAPLADSLAQAISAAEAAAPGRAASEARDRVGTLSREAQEALDAAVRELREILSPEQWKRLPEAVRQPSRQILPARSFTIETGEVW